MTVGEAFASYDADILFTGAMSIKTRKNYIAALNSWRRACGRGIPVSLVTHESIVAWKQYMIRAGMQPSSIASNLSRFRSVLKYLKQHGYDVLDYSIIERPKVIQKPPTWLELAEVKQFLNVIASKRDKAIFGSLFSTGARVSELLQLDRDSITNGEAEIIGKGSKPGRLIFDDACLRLIDDYLSNRKDKLRPLFVSGHYRRITVSRVEQLCHIYADLAGIQKNVTPHTWRHTFATDLRNNGMDIYDLSRQLRHARITSTMVYVHSTSQRRGSYETYHSPTPTDSR